MTTPPLASWRAVASRALHRAADALFAADPKPDKSLIGAPPLSGPERGERLGRGRRPAVEASAAPYLTGVLDGYLSGNPASDNRLVRATEDYTASRGGVGLFAIDAEVYDRWQEILDKNLHVAGLVEQRLAMVTERARSLQVDAETPLALEAKELVNRELMNFRGEEEGDGMCVGLSGRLGQMLLAIFYGVSILEVLWQKRDDGLIGIERLPHRWPGQFVFDARGRIYLADATQTPLPARKFVVARAGFPLLWDNPYGVGLLHKLRTLDHIKRAGEKFWAIYVETFGSPTVVARIKAEAPEKEKLKERLLNVFRDLGKRLGIVVEDNVEFEQFARTVATGRISTYHELIRYIESLEARLILGSTLTTQEAEFGTRAQAAVHEDTTEKRTKPDADMLMAVVNRQLVRPLLDFNFGRGRLKPEETPRFVIEVEEPETAELRLKRFVTIQKDLGLPISPRFIRAEFGAPAPEPDEVEAARAPEPPAPSGSGGGAPRDGGERGEDREEEDEEDGDERQAARGRGGRFAEGGAGPSFVTEAARRRAARFAAGLDQVVGALAAEGRAGALALVDRVAAAVGEEGPVTPAALAGVAPFAFPEGATTRAAWRAEVMAFALALVDAEADAAEQGGSLLRAGFAETRFDDDLPPAFPATPLEAYREAIAWLQSREIMTAADLASLRSFLTATGIDEGRAAEMVRVRAFALAGEVDVVVTALVRDSIVEAVREGIPFVEWRRQFDAIPSDQLPGGGAQARLEVIYRNEVNRAYHEQRETLYRDPDVRRGLLGFEWYNPNDERSRPDHAALIGFIPIDSPWASEVPPLGHNCRCAKYPVLRLSGRVAPEVDAADLDRRWQGARRFTT